MTVTASKYDVKANYFYETEAWATEALVRQFPVSGMTVWEPAAGNHKMADVLRAAGAKVWTSDIARYDIDQDEIFDFLQDSLLARHFGFSAVITNPPYGKGNRIAVQFIRNALDVCQNGMVAMLLTAKFDFGSTRVDLFRDNPRFVAKIHLIDRISWEGNGKTGTEDHAWYVWGPRPIVPQKPVIYYAGRKAVTS